MKKSIFIIMIIMISALVSCGDMAQDIKDADSQDKDTLRWDTPSTTWDNSEWGK